MKLTRRTFMAGAAGTAAAALVPIKPTFAGAAAPNSAGNYADNVTFALQQGIDLWGETLLTAPNGPTLENVQPLLPPANLGSTYVTQSGWYYLPFTDKVPEPATWIQQRDFALHVADGSQITAQWCWADFPANRQFVNFFVTPEEGYGSAPDRLDPPALWGDYLPVLSNSYTDAAGIRWDQESFAARVPETTALVSFVRFTVTRGHGPASATLRLALQAPGDTSLASDGLRVTSGADTYLVASAHGNWTAPNLDIPVDLSSGRAELYFAILAEKAPADALQPAKGSYEKARAAVASYWRGQLTGGATIDVPEKYALAAMRGTLLQNLVMGWQQAIGNGYESTDSTFAFVPEVSTSVAPLGEFGFTDSYRKNLQEILRRGQGDGTFPNWEKGIKLQSAAHYYFLTNDASYIRDNLDTFTGYLSDFSAQRVEDPNGLLAKQQYGSDIPEAVYGVHHQADGWRGMQDFAIALRLLGENTLAQQFGDAAGGLKTALEKAIATSSEKLPDGSAYVPISLLDPTAASAYELIPKNRDGSYWNLTMPYAAATGIFGDTGPALLRYMYDHGALFLGMTRFNATGVDPGVIETGAGPTFPAGAAGYDTTGIDQQYGYSLLKFLADAGENDRLVLEFYGKLAHDLTPNTFICGEGATIGTSRAVGRAFRSMWFPPLSANNAVYLRTLRELLIRETRDADNVPTTLHIAPATPRNWLAAGKRIAVTDLPTLFGPVSYSLVSNGNRLTATITPPTAESGRLTLTGVVLHARVPAGKRLVSATVNGKPAAISGDTVNLGQIHDEVTVVVQLGSLSVRQPDKARPATVNPGARVSKPGDVLPLNVTVEAFGASTVAGRMRIAEWNGPSVPFSVKSDGRIGWQEITVPLQIPRTTKPGNYRITLIAEPTGERRDITVEIGSAQSKPYSQVVLADEPLGYWRLNEISGSTAKDSSGHGLDGIYTGDVQFTGSNVVLDGGYIDVPGAAVTGPFTVEAWINPIGSTQQGLLEKYDSPALNGYVFRTTVGNKLHLETLWDSPPAQNPPPGATGPTTIYPGIWHHVAGVFDGSSVRVYLDGQLEASASAPHAPTAGSGPLRIGARGDDANERLSGGLDEVAIYDHALSAAAIKSRWVQGILAGRN
jgi:hypothetical protein